MGDSTVGKTAIRDVFVYDKIHDGISLATRGFDKISKSLEINGKKL